MQTWLDVRLPSDPSAPSLARRALRELPDRLQSDFASLELLVSELVTNSVKHASLLPSDEIELIVRETEDSVRVEVRDPGARYDEALDAWTGVRGGGPPPAAVPSGGYGLRLVGSTADRSGLTWDEGTVAWFELNRRPDGERNSGPSQSGGR